MKYPLIIVVLLIWALGWVAHISNERTTIYKATETLLKAQLDSLKTKNKAIELQYDRLNQHYTKILDSMKVIHNKNLGLIKRYEKLKNQPVEHLTDSAIINQINKLYAN